MENKTNIQRCMFVTLDNSAVQDAYWSYIVNIAINSGLVMPTIILNTIVLAAIWKTTSLHTPSNMLIFSLALSDLLIGAITEPLFVAYKVSEINGRFDEYCEMGVQVVALYFVYFLSTVSFATLAEMSIDRYLAIHLGMRYRLVVTPSRVVKSLVLVWLFGMFIGSLLFYLPAVAFSKVASAIMAIFLSIMCFAYIKAFRSLKQHQSQMATNASQSEQSYMSKERIERFRKTLYTVLYILGLILLCYVPHFFVFIAISATGLNSATRAGKNLANPFVIANSCLNPLLYWWKIKEIRRASWNIFRKTFRGQDDYSTSDNGTLGSNKVTALSSSGGLELSSVAETKSLDAGQNL